MKKINSPARTLLGIATLLIIFIFTSCKKTPSTVRHSSGPPVLDHVQSVLQGKPTINGAKPGETVVVNGKNLKGTKKVMFNGVKAHINHALVSDHDIIITIPDETPFGDASGGLVITNDADSASLPFNILQPPPTITSFSPYFGPPGSTLTITGKVFNHASTVRFGDKEDGKSAEIVSVSKNKIKVLIPKEITGSNHIYVTTPGGSVRSENVYGFKIFVYGDTLFNPHDTWEGTSFSATHDYQNTEHVQSGTHSIKITLTAGSGALKITNWEGSPVDLSDITAFKFSVYTGSGIQKLAVFLNGDWHHQPIITTTPGQYKVITVPLSKLNNISQLNEITIQSVGALGTFYIDNIGFI